MIDVADLRRDYAQGGLSESDLTEEPMELFENWLGQAIESGIHDPTGMVVSTVDENGQPSSRMVLLKSFDKNSLVFFTNYGSHKVSSGTRMPDADKARISLAARKSLEQNIARTRLSCNREMSRAALPSYSLMEMISPVLPASCSARFHPCSRRLFIVPWPLRKSTLL